MDQIDYRTDNQKHFVRRNGWLPATLEQLRSIRKRNKKIPPKYFTFCAAEAIDIFMLEHESILKRSESTGRLEGVFFCEKEQDDFRRIAELIGSPEQGFLGDFSKIVLFADDAETEGKSVEDTDFYEEDLRKKLRTKDAHSRLRGTFPFDVINLDVFGVMFPPRKGIISPLLQAIIKILEWQTISAFPNDKQCNKFTLFLTSHLDRNLAEPAAVDQLINKLNQNIDTHGQFQQAFYDRFDHSDPSRLADENFSEFFCVAFPKYLIEKAVMKFGWKVEYKETYLYSRENHFVPGEQYQMMHSVAVFTRLENPEERLDAPSIAEYVNSVTDLVSNRTINVDEELNDEMVEDIQNDLNTIAAFRDRPKD